MFFFFLTCTTFAGEKQGSVFSRGELRHSQEWLGNGWTQMKERPDLVPAVLSSIETKQGSQKSFHDDSAQVTDSENKSARKDEFKDSCSGSESDKDGKAKELKRVLDLSKDNFLGQLKWNSSKKRRRGSGSSAQKLHQLDAVVSNGAPDVTASRTCERFGIPTSLKLDHENCKYVGDSLFSSSVVPPLTSLVMSR